MSAVFPIVGRKLLMRCPRSRGSHPRELVSRLMIRRRTERMSLLARVVGPEE
jgi:hypothetical protein